MLEKKAMSMMIDTGFLNNTSCPRHDIRHDIKGYLYNSSPQSNRTLKYGVDTKYIDMLFSFGY